MAEHPVLIGGAWRAAKAAKTFQADQPGDRRAAAGRLSGQRLGGLRCRACCGERRPRSSCDGCRREAIAEFLTRFADRIEARQSRRSSNRRISRRRCPESPRLADVELPRTTDQLRQAADAALEGSWALPTIDTKNQHSIVLRADRAGRRVRPEQFSVRVLRRRRRRFRGGDRRRQSGHRQGAPAASGDRPAARRSGGCRTVGRRIAAGDRAADLQDRPSVGRSGWCRTLASARAHSPAAARPAWR